MIKKAIFWRFVVILLVIGFSLYSALPLDKKINLGLDLQGGMHLVYEVDLKKGLQVQIESLINGLERLFEDKGMKVSKIKTRNDNIFVFLSDKEKIEPVKKIIKDEYTVLEFVSISDLVMEYTLKPGQIEQFKRGSLEQSLETLRNRIDQFGVAEPLVQQEGESRIIIQLPGIKDRERAFDVIGKTARLEFRMIDNSMTPQEAMEKGVPFESEILYEKETDLATGKQISSRPYLVKRKVEIGGDSLSNAVVRVDQFNRPYVHIEFNKEGARQFEKITGDNIGKNMAIVLDGSLYSAPVIRSRIAGGLASIEGGFTYNEAKDLAIVLRAGSLHAPLTKLEERSVGPSLGKDSIRQGVISVIIGIVVVMVFMIVYYKFAGVVANIALLMNMIVLMGGLAYLGATLTLPGIAGIILTIGMAVDANVLIFERIKEELAISKTIKASVESGFARAFPTIVDANVTTLLATLFLFQFGTGPIKGFAVTLSLGIVASMFTAIYVSRSCFMVYLARSNVKTLSI